MVAIAPWRNGSIQSFCDWQGSCDCQVFPLRWLRGVPKPINLWSAKMAKLHHTGIVEERALKQAAIIRGMLNELDRTIQLLNTDISNEEARVRVSDRSDRAYPILARTLATRRDNLRVTVADLEHRLRTLNEARLQITADAA
jgi:hypothetical protein